MLSFVRIEFGYFQIYVIKDLFLKQRRDLNQLEHNICVTFVPIRPYITLRDSIPQILTFTDVLTYV